ncbi:hypothetical protein Cabys_4018 [Caldithrix abyssi DSM 13497]|uniref:Uncharacterized protein n=1 Tax=Caldithrix abyssi DSM 13497 TaxID=880073 RepID=A0A1J1CDH5_CALAY|nr:hypothetical protein Cabys_4018 [Caldithrix abyssi DSM 13497]
MHLFLKKNSGMQKNNPVNPKIKQILVQKLNYSPAGHSKFPSGGMRKFLCCCIG